MLYFQEKREWKWEEVYQTTTQRQAAQESTEEGNSFDQVEVLPIMKLA